VGLFLFNGFIFFVAEDDTHGNELWRTDGTPAGTVLVKDINPGTRDGASYNSYYYTTSGLYFTGNDGTSGNEPFVSNGLSSGTSIVANINTVGTSGSDPEFSFIKSGTLYFTADNGNSTSGYTDFYKLNATLSDLPVTLLDFSATLQSNSVQLNWATSSEINSKSFEILRSTDAVHFDNIGRVDAAGNSSVERKYIYDDVNAFNAGSDVLYYRLQIIDKDGKSKYSEVLQVKLKGAVTELKIYPNPSSTFVQVGGLDNSTPMRYFIYNAEGVAVQQGNLDNERINFKSDLPKGLYTLRVTGETANETLRFVVE